MSSTQIQARKLPKYESYLSPFDNSPALYPSAPLWPTDPEMCIRVNREIKPKPLHVNILALVLDTKIRQLDGDNRSRHFDFLVAPCSDEEEKSIKEWCENYVAPAGLETKKILKASGDPNMFVSKHVFIEEYYNKNMELSLHPYEKPSFPIPKPCDQCDAPCEMECLCGAPFCSRICLKFHFPQHRRVCEAIFEESKYGPVFTSTEFKKLRSAELAFNYSYMGDPAAIRLLPEGTLSQDTCGGCSRSELKNPQRCSRCEQQVYCNRDCQKNHWARHKLVCKAASTQE
jgi:MYND finger